MCIVNRDEYKHLLYENRANKKKSLQFALGIPHNFYALLKKNIDEQRKTLKFFGEYFYMVVLLDNGDLVYCTKGVELYNRYTFTGKFQGVDPPMDVHEHCENGLTFIGKGVVHHFERY